MSTHRPAPETDCTSPHHSRWSHSFKCHQTATTAAASAAAATTTASACCTQSTASFVSGSIAHPAYPPIRDPNDEAGVTGAETFQSQDIHPGNVSVPNHVHHFAHSASANVSCAASRPSADVAQPALANGHCQAACSSHGGFGSLYPRGLYVLDDCSLSGQWFTSEHSDSYDGA